VHRPAAAAGESQRRVDADGAVDGAEELRGGDRPILRAFAAGSAGANGLAHLQTTAGDQGRHDRRPVVAAGALVDFRGAAELAPPSRPPLPVPAPLGAVLGSGPPPLVPLGGVAVSVAEVCGGGCPSRRWTA